MRLFSYQNLFQEIDQSGLRLRFLARNLPKEAKEIIRDCQGTIYAICIGSTLICFRPLNYKDFSYLERVIELLGSYELEEYILSKCLVWPKTPDKLLGTYPGKITRTIIDISGWNNLDAFKVGLSYARKELLTHNKSIDIFLKTTFGMKDEDIEKMEFLERMHFVAWAEIITEKDLLEEKKDKKHKRIPGLNIDTAGLEGAIQTSTQETTLAVDKQGRPIKQQEVEQTIIYNTRLMNKKD